MSKKKVDVHVDIKFTAIVTVEVNSDDDKDAKKKADYYINDMYHLDSVCAYHDPKQVDRSYLLSNPY